MANVLLHVLFAWPIAIELALILMIERKARQQ